MTRIGIVGSRQWPDPGRVIDTVDALVGAYGKPPTIVSGGANGVDTWAAEHAARAGLTVEVMPAHWATYGRGAGVIRNEALVKSCDQLLVFWNGVSPGTRNVIELAMKHRVPFQVVFP